MLSVCLSTFPSVTHFRCRLHSLVQALKGERFSGWILSAGGRFRPKRLAARPFNFQGLLYYLRRRAKERSEWRNRETPNIADLWYTCFKYCPAIMKNAPSFCSFIKKLYLCSKMSCTSMQITQVCRNQNSCQLITSFLNFPHKLFILSGLWDYSKNRI